MVADNAEQHMMRDEKQFDKVMSEIMYQDSHVLQVLIAPKQKPLHKLKCFFEEQSGEVSGTNLTEIRIDIAHKFNLKMKEFKLLMLLEGDRMHTFDDERKFS